MKPVSTRHQFNHLLLCFLHGKMLKCGHSNIKLPLIPTFLLWEAVVNTHPAWWPARSPARICRSSSGWRSAPAPGTLRRQEKQVRKLGRFLSVGNKAGEKASDIISFTSLVVLRMKHLGFYFCLFLLSWGDCSTCNTPCKHYVTNPTSSHNL